MHIVSIVTNKNPSFGGPAIVMDYLPVNLQQFSSSSIPPIVLKCLAKQMLDALSYIHGQSIYHRDVKPGNILIPSLDPFMIKLADFGVSSIEKAKVETFCGTLRYIAPEITLAKAYDGKADVWSAGVVLAEYSLPEDYFQKLEENQPFAPAGIIESLKHIVIDKNAFTSLLQMMLLENVEKRYSSKAAWEQLLRLTEPEGDSMRKAVAPLREVASTLLPTETVTTVRLTTTKSGTRGP